MNKFTLAACMVSIAALSACEKKQPAVNADTEALYSLQKEPAKVIALSKPRTRCPRDRIVSAVSIFEADLPNPKMDEAAWFEANGQREGVMKRNSGLQYSVVQNGLDIAPSPSGAQMVAVNYQGVYRDGKAFDSSFTRAEPAKFAVNSVIRGWVEGLTLMKPCDAWTFYIPSHLAYGDTPPEGIKSNEPLIFHTQLLEVKLKK